jgi:prepilin-type N-terminal cleavage/methylation domain-containing protein
MPAAWVINCVNSNNRTGTRGFTLIELLVSVTIMAMISAVVVSGLRSGMLAWDKGTKHIEELRRSRVVFQVMHDAIAGALPLMYTVKTDKGPARRLAFDGGNNSVRFVSRMSFKDGPNSIPRWIFIRWMGGANEQSGKLIAEERTIIPPDNLPDAAIYWSGAVLEADRCSFDFLPLEAPGKLLVWTRDWRPLSDQLPKAIRIVCNARSKETSSVTALEYAASFAAGLRFN